MKSNFCHSRSLFVFLIILLSIVLISCKETNNLKKSNKVNDIDPTKIKNTVNNVISKTQVNSQNAEANKLLSSHNEASLSPETVSLLNHLDTRVESDEELDDNKAIKESVSHKKKVHTPSKNDFKNKKLSKKQAINKNTSPSITPAKSNNTTSLTSKKVSTNISQKNNVAFNPAKQINTSGPQNLKISSKPTTKSHSEHRSSVTGSSSNSATKKQLPSLIYTGFENKPTTTISFYPVKYVKQLSPAGKAALDAQNSGDLEYLAILNSGYETPKFTNSIITHYDTNVTGPKKIEHLWTPSTPSGDASLWTNVEFHKFGNNIMENHKFNTPAKFTMDKYGDTIVHAPSDSSMRIIKRTPTITSFSTFLGIGDDETLF